MFAAVVTSGSSAGCCVSWLMGSAVTHVRGSGLRPLHVTVYHVPTEAKAINLSYYFQYRMAENVGREPVYRSPGDLWKETLFYLAERP